jgi:LAS superfamily LD-carboxypeptidase LdcB
MKRPTQKPKLPSALAKAKNGQLTEKQLASCGIPGFKMAPPAARAMKALVLAAREAGFRLTATGTYRSLDAQERVFRQRYTRFPLENAPTRTWNGNVWYQKPRTAQVAVPGTSNHGFGLSADLALINEAGRVVSLSPACVRWLAKNAAEFGFRNEVGVNVEPWHWTWYGQDSIPQAVLDVEENKS